MDDDRKKTVMIVLSVVCIASAGGIVYWTQFSGGERKVPVILLCTDKNCGYIKETNSKDMWEGVDRPDPGLAMEMGPMTFPCPKCGKKTMVVAEKCPKCGEVFAPKLNTRDFPDRCPKCKYSLIEEKSKQVE